MNVAAPRLEPGGMSIVAGPAEPEVRGLLEESGLPVADLTPERLKNFRACRTPAGLATVVGLERHGDVGLLHSLAVAAEQSE